MMMMKHDKQCKLGGGGLVSDKPWLVTRRGAVKNHLAGSQFWDKTHGEGDVFLIFLGWLEKMKRII